MKYRNPLKKILTETRSSWDHCGTRDVVRRVFATALQCRTAELGAEVYSSDNQELISYHTCKSRACTSCGNRASIQWRRERWAALPTQSYHGITFTIAFPGGPPQPFKGYIFTQSGPAYLAGFTWWQGLPFGWYAAKI